VVIGAYYQPRFYDPVFYDPWYYSPFYSRWYTPFYPPYYGYVGRYDISGSIRLQVTPPEAEVFVDGYHAGTVDDFDGVFQRLHIEPGEHDLELYLPGHRTVQRRIYVQPTGTLRLRFTMEPLGPGDATPVRPEPRARPLPDESRPLPPRAGPDPGPRGAGPRGAGPGQAPPPGTRGRAGGRGPAAEGFGALSLRVQPGEADVLLDGEAWEGPGDDERLVVQLGVGTHRLEIRKDGYRSYSTEVNVRAGETTVLNVALTRQ
jgi:hypothetical protein